MVLLRRLCRWCALCDLQILLGRSRSGLSRVSRFMLTIFNRRYGKLVSNVKIWSEHFPAFAKHLRGMGFPIDNGVLFVDGTLKETCSVCLFASVYRLCVKISDLFSLLCLLAPCGAGNGCVFVNMKDHQVFQGKDRNHGNSYLLGAVGW